MNRTFTLQTDKTYKAGWGVCITPIWDGFDGVGEHVADIDVQIVKIAPETVTLCGGVWCVRITQNGFVPIDNFKDLDELDTDDTHDLRDRWFATRKDAAEHARYTENRWKHPQPWESFIAL